MSSIRKVMERALMAIVFFAASALFFLIYMDVIQYRHTKQLCEDFVYEISKDGSVTDTDYYIFLDAVSDMDTSMDVKLSHTKYLTFPLYDYYEEAAIANYFAGRNHLKEVKLPSFPVVLPEIHPELLERQDKTNAAVLSSLSSDGYVPLPEDDVTAGVVYEAVCDVQSVYENELLCTIVRVTENGITYYAEADMVSVGFSGTGSYELQIGGVPTGAYVNIESFPRTIMCSNGHETLVTEERIAKYQLSGTYGPCPFCAMIPGEIEATQSNVTATIGTGIESLGTSLSVVYQDGHRENLDFSDEELYCSYDSSYCGTQIVRFSYKGIERAVLTVTLSGALCDVCGSPCAGKNMADYDRFPYCNACMAGMPFFMGTTYTEQEFIGNDEIITELITEKKYSFSRGDYVEIYVSYKGNNLPIPFLGRDIKMPIIKGESIRTDGR